VTGVEIRKGKLFDGGRNAAVVAMDHGMFDGPHAGMEDIPGTLERIGDEPDAVLLSPGALRASASFFGRRGAPPAIVRINFNTVFCVPWGYKDSVCAPAVEPEEAQALGAEMVLICLTMKTGREETDASNASLFARLCSRSHSRGLPVVGEYFPHSHLTKGREEFHEEILIGCRMLQELGADFIKTFHTHRFKEVTGKVGVPILGLGAEKTATDLAALELAERQVADGARGVVFGRNVVQASDPRRFLQALKRVVKEGAKASEAVQGMGLTS